MRVITVLWEGKSRRFGVADVAALRASIPPWYPLVVLYLADPDVPGWWGKCGVFDQPGRNLFLDLDSRVVGDLGVFGRFALAPGQVGMLPALRGYESPLRSGAMLWDGPLPNVPLPDDLSGGDQEWIAAHVDAVPLPAELFQSAAGAHKFGVEPRVRVLIDWKPKYSTTRTGM